MRMEIKNKELFESFHVAYSLTRPKGFYKNEEDNVFLTMTELHVLVNDKPIEYYKSIIDFFRKMVEIIVFYTDDQEYICKLKQYKCE